MLANYGNNLSGDKAALVLSQGALTSDASAKSAWSSLAAPIVRQVVRCEPLDCAMQLLNSLAILIQRLASPSGYLSSRSST